MRVDVESVIDFLSILEREYSIFQNTIWVDVVHKSLDESLSVHESLKVSVTLQASAVIVLKDGSQYLLRLSEMCGVDYLDGEKELNGTEVAEKKKGLIENWISRKQYEYRILPGVVSI